MSSKGGVRYPNSITVRRVKSVCRAWLANVLLQYTLSEGAPPIGDPHVEIEKYYSEAQRLGVEPNIRIYWSGLGGAWVQHNAMTHEYASEALIKHLHKTFARSDEQVRQYGNRTGALMCTPRLWVNGYTYKHGRVER